MPPVDARTMTDFQATVWDYYARKGRVLPWRSEGDGPPYPYHVLVSEMMLQQTQVTRVLPKYESFLRRFPTISDLSGASLGDVLTEWSGLGYNRRAKFLWQAVRIIDTEHRGHVPTTMDALVALPGIGKNTAAAILTYAYNQSHPFIETNVRTVFIRHFFPDVDKVGDNELLPLVATAIDNDSPREWYWALMDYGTYLKATERNYARASTQYARQDGFQGSKRQLRGLVIRLLSRGPMTIDELCLEASDQRLGEVLENLLTEQLIMRRGDGYDLPSA